MEGAACLPIQPNSSANHDDEQPSSGCLRSCNLPDTAKSAFRGKNMTANGTVKLALLWPRDAPKWHAATPHDYRLGRVFEEMAALGIEAEPAIYADDVADQVREQLLRCDGVLVWVDPLFAGRNRIVLDAMLRDVASKGVWVSTHPDVILKMGVKEVLYRTRHLGWGTDTHLYRAAEAFHEEFPQRLQRRAAGPQAEPRQRWRGRVEGRTRIRIRASTPQPFGCCTRPAAACPRICRSAIS